MQNFKLSQIVSIAQNGFKQLFSEFDFWFETEVSKIKIVQNKVYLDLIECEEDGKLVAKAKGCIFDINIWDNFQKDVNFTQVDEIKGCKLLLHGLLNFHPEYGLSIYINQISSEYVLGQLKKNQDNIKQQLMKLGIYEKNKSLEMNFPTYDIAVISTLSSEGLKDFQTTLENSGYQFNVHLYEASIHGNDAKSQVYNQLKKIYTDIKNGKKIDIVSIVRGGGGSHGILWQYDLNIAKGICHMPVPVMMAIGHTSDKSILDEISKFSAQTPTQAAYFLIQTVENYLSDCRNFMNKINDISNTKLKLIKVNIDNLFQQLSQNFQNRINFISLNVSSLYAYINSFSPNILTKYGYGILLDKDSHYLTKNQIENLSSGDEVYLNIYNKKILIEIKKM